MSFVKDIIGEFGIAFCVCEVFPMFFKSCVKVSIILEELQHPQDLVEKVVITTKGLQDRNNNSSMEGLWKINVN